MESERDGLLKLMRRYNVPITRHNAPHFLTIVYRNSVKRQTVTTHFERDKGCRAYTPKTGRGAPTPRPAA
jgi:hypothetical protein